MINSLKRGLILTCLALLCACSSTPNTQVITRTVVQQVPVYLTPPASLLADCLPDNSFNVTTNADGIDYSNWLESLLLQCHNNIQLIKRWANEVKPEGQSHVTPQSN
jgi:hypothetical protein